MLTIQCSGTNAFITVASEKGNNYPILTDTGVENSSPHVKSDTRNCILYIP